MLKETTRTAERMALSEWIRRMAMPVGGWKCFHTAGFIPKMALDWAWKGDLAHGNMARDEWDAMQRYKRFMQERDRKSVSWVAAVERNPDWSGVNKGWHVHAMWTAEGDIWRTSSWRRWANQWGNNKLKSIVGDDKAVSNYLGKYVLNDLCLVEWQVNGGLWHALNTLHEHCPQFFRYDSLKIASPPPAGGNSLSLKVPKPREASQPACQ